MFKQPIVFFFLLFICLSNFIAAQFKPYEVQIKQARNNGVYTAKDSKIGLNIKIKNNQTDNVKGTATIEAINQYNQVIHKEEAAIFINPKSNFFKLIQIDASKFSPGFYTVVINSTTNYGNSTNTEVVAIEPTKVKPIVNQPTDFLAFWNETKNELAAITPMYKITRRGDVSTINNDVFLIEFTSLNNLLIRGWLSVPKTGKKNGVLYKLPNYAQATGIDNRSNVATFCIDARGIGMSGDNVQLNATNYLIAGIGNKYTYVYKGLIADAVRGVDFLLQNASQLRLDTAKIVTYGEGQGAALASITAALHNKVKGVVANRIQLADVRTAIALGEQKNYTGFPIGIIKNYAIANQQNLDIYFKTWDYFDALSFAPLIKCPILIATNIKDTQNFAPAAYNFYNQILTTTREFYSVADTDSGMNNSYYIFENNWLKEILRLPN
jgi:cephalosporin-C deacetylase